MERVAQKNINSVKLREDLSQKIDGLILGEKSIVKELLYRELDINAKSMAYGKANEALAIEALELSQCIAVKKCGLHIDAVILFLGATPDGLIDDDGIVEVKCPIPCENVSPQEAILARKIKFWTTKKQKTEILAVDKNHSFFIKFKDNCISLVDHTVCLQFIQKMGCS